MFKIGNAGVRSVVTKPSRSDGKPDPEESPHETGSHPMRRRWNIQGHAALALGLAVVGMTTGCGGRLVWRPDLGGAMRLAARENRIVVVAYWSVFNKDCMEMERKVLRSENVIETMAGTVPVRLNAALNKSWAGEAGVSRVPSFVVYAPDGRILRRHEGFLDEPAFRGFIVAAKLSM